MKEELRHDDVSGKRKWYHRYVVMRQDNRTGPYTLPDLVDQYFLTKIGAKRYADDLNGLAFQRHYHDIVINGKTPPITYYFRSTPKT